MKVVRFEGDVSCPFCNGTMSATEDAGGMVLHSIPYCARFEKLDALEFLREVNKAIKELET